MIYKIYILKPNIAKFYCTPACEQTLPKNRGTDSKKMGQ